MSATATRAVSDGRRTRERAQHLVQDLFQGLFSNYVEAGFVFDDQQKLIYSFGEIERYTRLPQGLVRLDSLSIIVEGLKSPMMLAIRQAQSSRGDVSLRNVELKGPNGPTRVDIRVFRIESKGFPTSLYVAVIEDSRPAAETSNTSVIEQDVTAQSRVDELEHELASTKESLQAAIEELETSNEEMQSTNEELVASNEELQSTNEELQSVNEELHTINTEYQNKIAELTEISADLEEFLNVSEIGTVFLDADLCIRKYTPGVRNAIPIREHDLGRPLTDLGHNLVDIDLEQLVEGTLRKRTALDREVRTARGQRFYLRVRPYDPRSGRSRGVLLAFVDMTSEEVIREDMQRLEALIEFTSEKEPDIVYWTYDLTRAGFEFASEGFHHIWDQSVQKLLESEQTWFDAIPPGDRQRCRDAFSHVRNLREFSILHRVRHEDGSVRWVRSSGQYHDGGRERRPAILGFSHDMTGLVDVRGKVLAARSMPGTSTQQLLRVLAETTGQALLVADGENEIIFVNGPASERFSKKPQELMGNDLRALISNQDSFDSVTAGRSRAEKLRLQIIGEDEPIDATIAHLPDLTLAGTALLLVF
jgi:two-component system CheB/CheR fusion protein